MTAGTQARPGRAPTSSRARQRLTPWLFLAPFLALFVFFFVAPILYAGYQALTRVERSGALGAIEARTVFAGTSNFAQALSDDAFVASFVRILGFAAVQVPVMIILALALALLLDGASVRWPKAFRSVFFLPYGVPGVIASIVWGFLYTPGVSPVIDLLGAAGVDVNFLGRELVLYSIANIVVWQFAGYNMLVIVAQLQTIPGDLYESARIDGANAWHIARWVKIPLIRPALVLTTVFTIIGTLQLFAEPLVLQSISTSISTTYTPNLAAYTEAFGNNNYNLAAAEAVLLALLALVLSFGFLKLVGSKDSAS